MDRAALFAELTRDLFGVLLDGAELSLEQRVLAVHAGLSAVMAAGSGMPVVPGAVGGSGSPFDDAGWPGFGSYERYWSVGGLAEPGPPVPVSLSDALGFVASELWRGLEAWEGGDPERAVGCWGLGFETTWGPACAELLLARHPHVAAYRADARGRTRSRRADPGVGGVTLAAPRAPTSRPVLGVRFGATPDGVRVVAVHPAGPAAGRLLPDDLLLSVDGESLAELGADAVGARLAGAVGEVRRVEVLRGDRTELVDLTAVDASELG